mgnify:CR=1 FL=1
MADRGAGRERGTRGGWGRRGAWGPPGEWGPRRRRPKAWQGFGCLFGLLFLVVSLSYAEGTAAIPETGGAATFTRRAFNDLVGFATGWVLLLDYLIVIALSTLFLPHYLAASFSEP